MFFMTCASKRLRKTRRDRVLLIFQEAVNYLIFSYVLMISVKPWNRNWIQRAIYLKLIFTHFVPTKLILWSLIHLKFKLLLKLPFLFLFSKPFSFCLFHEVHLYLEQLCIFLLNFSLGLLFLSQLALKEVIFVETTCLLYLLRLFSICGLLLMIFLCL